MITWIVYSLVGTSPSKLNCLYVDVSRGLETSELARIRLGIDLVLRYFYCFQFTIILKD